MFDDDCPVVNKKVLQKYLCEECYEYKEQLEHRYIVPESGLHCQEDSKYKNNKTP